MADDIAVLGIAIDATGIKEVARDLDKITAAAKSAERQSTDFVGAQRQVQRQLEQMLAPLRAVQQLIAGFIGVQAVISRAAR